MREKGVSPIIATVLLIGIVVALSLMIFLWMRAFTKEVITKFDGENVELVCNKVMIQASYAAGQLSLSNIGNVPIYDIRIRKSSAGGYTNDNARNNPNWPKYGLNPGTGFLGDIPGLTGDITLVPILLGNSDKGKRVFACDENRNGYEL
jgi:flagellin-like protein